MPSWKMKINVPVDQTLQKAIHKKACYIGNGYPQSTKIMLKRLFMHTSMMHKSKKFERRIAVQSAD